MTDEYALVPRKPNGSILARIPARTRLYSNYKEKQYLAVKKQSV